jgi:mono/diheme cytochrome c family protein
MLKNAVVFAAGLWALSFQAQASDVDLGKKVFTKEAQPGCSLCHALADAGAVGAIGPDLDELKPSREQVVNAVTGGVGIMPAFNESLSADQIGAVADYIVQVTGGGS